MNIEIGHQVYGEGTKGNHHVVGTEDVNRFNPEHEVSVLRATWRLGRSQSQM